MIKVFHIITSFEVGGAERVAINIAKSATSHFEYHIFEVIKSTSTFSIALKKELQVCGVKYHESPIRQRKLAIILYPLWFLWYYIKIKPNVIHSHAEISDLALWLFRKIAWIAIWVKPKFIRTIHNTQQWNEWKGIGNIVEHYYLSHRCSVAISQSTQQNYQKCYGGELPPIIYNGLEEVEQKAFPYIVKGKINILFAGRLESQKGVDIMIEVVKRVKSNNFHFHIIGNGSMKELVQKKLSGKGNVSLYDAITGLNQYMGSFDYLFMPSRYEGLALMPIEASLAHTPTIINRSPGLKDTMPKNWELGVDDNSIDDYINLFGKLPNSEDYKKLADKAYQYALLNFSIRKMQIEYESLYK